MGREFIMPKEIITGHEAMELAGKYFKQFGEKALIVTDSVMVKLGNVEKVEHILKKEKVEYEIFEGIDGEPTDVMIQNGKAIYMKGQCDFLIAVGGGSAIDSMKAIAVLVANGGEITDYVGQSITGVFPKMAAIPTTAGTGAEATQFTIITDTKNNIKMLLRGRNLIPDLAVIDSQFTLTAPPKITAATGVDALTHAIEAYTSQKAQTLSDVFALSAIKRIFQYLPVAFRDGKNEKAREQMAIAALEAGIAFNNSSVTLVHGMSRPIGALFHVPHGISNAMLLKECLMFALEGNYSRFADLGRAIKAADEKSSDQLASERFLTHVEQLCKKLEIPTLEEYGIDKNEYYEVIDKMVHDAMESGSPQNTWRKLHAEDLKHIYSKLWK